MPDEWNGIGSNFVFLIPTTLAMQHYCIVVLSAISLFGFKLKQWVLLVATTLIYDQCTVQGGC